MLRESCPTWLQEVLFVAERRLLMAGATVHYTGGVLRIYQLGQPRLVLEGVSDHYVRSNLRFVPDGPDVTGTRHS